MKNLTEVRAEVDPELKKQIKVKAILENKTTAQIVEEILREFFEKRN